jgi:hypothetical protein
MGRIATAQTDLLRVLAHHPLHYFQLHAHRVYARLRLKSHRTDCRVVDPGQHGPALIEGALHIGEGLTINPRLRV